ncbi:S53 family peptidase [Agreia sp. PsM10]|uniref:S53 family peptidase n=1 Tax=Agreia sp. PsM10 TaxID=3030533 RepID=UPI00263A3E10|nr:S53 family peptidase [Agreia sp. PsM10]MDN4641111.1 S53 family peptidase [Agreia sp. PsM10]
MRSLRSPGSVMSASATLIVGVVCAGILTACASTPSASGDRHFLPDTAPDWAGSASADNDSSAPEGSTSAVVLFTENADPASISDARTWLVTAGLDLGDEHDSVHSQSISGSYDDFARAFSTTFATTDIHGRTAVAPSTDLSVPADLTAIETVAGLVSTDAMRPTLVDATPTQANATGAPAAVAPITSDDCAAYWGQTVSSQWPESVTVEHRSNALCGYGPQQLRAIHQLPDDATGAGATIAIVGAFDDPTVEANTNTYFTAAGAQPLRDGQYTHHAPTNPDNSRCGGPNSWTVEQHLDVQAVHAMAPDADIVYWGSDTCEAQSLYLRLLDAVENDTADSGTPDVISLSFGAPEELDTDGDRTLLSRVLVEAASRGISVFASTGNDGDYSQAGDHQDGTDVASPASSPYVTAVGGASIGLGADNTVAVEAGWEVQTRFARNGAIIPPGFIYGAGGGESAYYDRPSWQRDTLAQPGSKRLLPDVSSLADPNTGFIVNAPSNGVVSEDAHGGTSLATPMVASMVAIAKVSNGSHVGLATPSLYALTGSSAITDVQPASAATWFRRSPSTGALWLETLYMWDTKPQSLQSGPGWDRVTGLGIPRGTDFLDQFGVKK